MRGTTSSEHIVQLFDSSQSLASAVARFAVDGLADNQTVLIVARPEHWSATATRIVALGADAEKAMADRQLIVLDAAATMNRFMAGSAPDAVLFDRVIGELVRDLLRRGRPLRIYGEMVDLLAHDHDFAGAHQLEELWNALGRQHPYTLFCGYSSIHFGAHQSTSALELICRCHTQVRESSDDDLASWLVNNLPRDEHSAIPR